MNVLVIAPHADDEVYGVGGTIARLASKGADVYVAIITRGEPPLFPADYDDLVFAEANKALSLLGVKETIFLKGFPAAKLDSIGHAELNASITELISHISPSILFVPFIGDVHFDHRLVFESCLVACRPNRGHTPEKIFAYETLSETNWNAPMLSPAFAPNTFIDISDFLEMKIAAIQIYNSQLREFPDERSLESARALAIHRGATAGLRAAEAFVLVRCIYKCDSILSSLT